MSPVAPELPEYQPGASLPQNLEPTNTPLSLRVIRAFTPFTMAQAILVEHVLGENSSGYLHLLETFLLKVYDPKFYSHRLPKGSSPARPCSLGAEAAAEWQEQNRGRDPDFEPWRQPDDDDAPGWEEWYYQNAEVQYHAEASAYNRLKALQGATMVRCYGTGLLQVPRWAFAPHALLLEFIPDVKTLDHVDPKMVPPNLIHSLLETAEKFGRLGVVHTDLNPGNILFSPSDNPLRAVIIDFGESGVREDESDEEWEETVEQNSDSVWMRKRLQQFLGNVMPRDRVDSGS